VPEQISGTGALPICSSAPVTPDIGETGCP
jgi:hypothetical protein